MAPASTSASTSTAPCSRRPPALLIKALEPYQPWFYEEIVQALNVDVMAELARKTHIPIATGERIFTKWGFREILEKRAATILQPDVCYAGGITELKIIAGMAEAYYSPIAPAQSARALLARRQPPDRRVDPELPDSGARRQRILRPARQAAAAGHERPPPAADRSGPRHHHRRKQAEGPGRRAPALPHRATIPTTARWSTGSRTKTHSEPASISPAVP